ncbi:MAG: hypothetical protein D6778_01700 [Nitrospirae bacterium]|nr:MAG: hypothetical protein D6778_01700 [Nitrospirota bacterium]
MKTSLTVNDVVIPLNEFCQRYIGNILRSIVESLDSPGKKVNVYIDRNTLRFYSDDREVEIRKDFTRLLVESTLKGVLSPLKGIFWLEKVNISTWVE